MKRAPSTIAAHRVSRALTLAACCLPAIVFVSVALFVANRLGGAIGIGAVLAAIIVYAGLIAVSRRRIAARGSRFVSESEPIDFNDPFWRRWMR